MYADRPDASKVAFVRAVQWLAGRGITLVDCQVHTEHLARFGAREIPRRAFLAAMRRALDRPTLRGHWTLDTDTSPEFPDA
jgi:leucyl/phenylalanyl-tRNA--protein transferase